MRKDKLKAELKQEILNEVSDELVDKIVNKVSERLLQKLPVSMQLELNQERSAKAYDRKSKPPSPDFNLSDLEQKAKEIEDYNKRHSSITPIKPRDWKEVLDDRQRTIESRRQGRMEQ